MSNKDLFIKKVTSVSSVEKTLTQISCHILKHIFYIRNNYNLVLMYFKKIYHKLKFTASCSSFNNNKILITPLPSDMLS